MLVLFLCLFLSPADNPPPVPFLYFFLLLAPSIHWFERLCSKVTNKMPLLTMLLLYRFLADRNLHMRRDVGPTNCTPNDPHASVFFFFFVFPLLYMQDTFVPFLNFKVGHFACHFLFLSFGIAMKGIQFTQLPCHISSLLHSVHHLFYFYPAMYDCWIHVNNSMPLVVSLNNESQLACWRQQSADSAFQFHYTVLKRNRFRQCIKWWFPK